MYLLALGKNEIVFISPCTPALIHNAILDLYEWHTWQASCIPACWMIHFRVEQWWGRQIPWINYWLVPQALYVGAGHQAAGNAGACCGPGHSARVFRQAWPETIKATSLAKAPRARKTMYIDVLKLTYLDVFSVRFKVEGEGLRWRNAICIPCQTKVFCIQTYIHTSFHGPAHW